MPACTTGSSTPSRASRDRMRGLCEAAAAIAQPRGAGSDGRGALRGVHRVYLRGVLLGDGLALELHRRRQLVTAGQPVALHERELLDSFHARELGVGGVDAI